MKNITITILMAVVVFSGCQLPTTPVSSTPATINPESVTVSSVFLSVPSSLSGDTTSRTLTSDGWVKSAVENYYRFARNQVAIGGKVAAWVKTLITGIEAVTLPSGKKLVGSSVTFNHTDEAKGLKTAWTSLENSKYRLERWRNSAKELEMELTYRLDSSGTTQVSGSMIIKVANTDWAAPASGEKSPDWIKILFDSSKDSQAWISISVEGYRSFADLGDTGKQNTQIVLTKDANGVISAVGSSMVTQSRHFVWNGYTLNSSNAEGVNAAATAETRYYLFAGKSTTDDKATVQLAIAPAGYTASSVYTDYAIGKIIGQLFRDRLVNNYDFNGSTDTNSDQGSEVLAILKLFDSTIDTATPANNTLAMILEALAKTKAALTTPSDIIEYLIDVSGVQNPAYFDTQAYQSNGATAPTGYLTAAQISDLAAIPEAEVSNMTLSFLEALTPSF